MDEFDAPLPTALEIASCSVIGTTSAANRPTGPPPSPLAALRLAVLPALQRPPCVVSFSGGMDSTFVLFVAARVAYEAGLPAPIPVTWRFTGAPRAEESVWQDRVMATMPELQWQLLHAEDDLDLIGPVAQRVVTRHGVLLPANVHLHLPIVEVAAGGSMLTGVGGDQVLVHRSRRGRLARIRARAPGRLVAAVRQRQGRDQFPWLQPSVSRRVSRTARMEGRDEPTSITERIFWQSRQRRLLLARASLDTIAAPSDVRVINPLLDPGFLAALANVAVRHQGASRARLLHLIAGEAFPSAATEQRPKAHFLEVFLRTPTREFVQSWDGRGADESIVDAATLRRLWSQWPIPSATAGLVQQLWLSSKTKALTG